MTQFSPQVTVPPRDFFDYLLRRNRRQSRVIPGMRRDGKALAYQATQFVPGQNGRWVWRRHFQFCTEDIQHLLNLGRLELLQVAIDPPNRTPSFKRCSQRKGTYVR